MKEAFDLIKERLEEKKKNAHDLHGKPHMDYGTLVGWESAMMYALDVVSEVEAEHINKSTEHINKSSDCSSGWIPVEKELPPEPEENPEFDGKPLEVYLVSFKDTKYPWRAFWNGKNFTDGWNIVHPEAWMPLPEPYKPEK